VPYQRRLAMKRDDVAIIGAGIVGVSALCALTRADIPAVALHADVRGVIAATRESVPVARRRPGRPMAAPGPSTFGAP